MNGAGKSTSSRIRVTWYSGACYVTDVKSGPGPYRITTVHRPWLVAIWRGSR
jgi:hypothetical protein